MKTAIVTGYCSGIGNHLTHYLINKNYNVIGLDINYIEIPGISKAYKVDCTKENEIKEIFNEIESLDIAVNCAGISGIRNDITNLNTTDIIDCFNTNFLSMFLSVKEEIKIMRKQNQGKIINMSSILSYIGIKNSLAYAASKAAIISLTKTAAAENTSYNIAINSISPATIATPMIEKLNKNKPKDYKSIYPIGRAGKVEDVISIIEMLIKNNFMTGNDIPLDGGLANLFSI